MEQISLPTSHECEYSDDPDARITGEESNEMEATFKVMHWNIKEVVISVLGIERTLVSIVDFFFKCNNRDLFREIILESDFFTFASMLKTIKQIQAAEQLVEAKEWKKLEEGLRRVMRYRNMLVHGRQTAFKDGEQILIRVDYFEGSPKSMVFDDDRWAKVQSAIRDTHDNTGLFLSKLFPSTKNAT